MPAIGRKPLPSGAARLGARALAIVYTTLALALSTQPLYADRAADVLGRINYVATALADDNAVDAMAVFDKSFGKYVKLREYFSGLTDSSQLISEVDVVDEQDSASQSDVTVQWTLTLTNRATLQSERRSRELHIRLTVEHGKWKIVDLSPIDFFNPQTKQQSK